MRISYSDAAQMELLYAIKNIRTESELNELKLALSHFFADKAQKELDELWDSGVLDQRTTSQNSLSVMKRLVVLDTNCLVQSLPAKSPYHKIWEDFLQGKFMLCVSNEILNEYEEIIERYSSASVARNVISAIVHSPYTLYKEASFKFNLIEADPDDNKFADCAIVANAEYIVSEDAHFRILATFPFPKIRVVGLDEFLTDLLVDI